MSRVVAVEKEGVEIVKYQLDNGDVIDKDQAIKMAEDGKIEGVSVVDRNGSKYLRSLLDGNENNNLQNLPEIK